MVLGFTHIDLLVTGFEAQNSQCIMGRWKLVDTTLDSTSMH